jgi:cytochrome b6-f complex iron-sulfur subunit
MDEKHAIAPSGDEKEISRRALFAKLGLGSLGVAAAGTLGFSYQFLSPNVLYEASPIVNVGKPESFSLDSVTLDATNGIFLVHAQEGFFALNAVCTHLGCLTAWKPDSGQIACPCHGSRFSREGVKLAGPAPRPLPWLRTWINDDGDLLVDRSTNIPAMQFLRI